MSTHTVSPPPPAGGPLPVRVGRALADRWASALGLSLGLLSLIDLQDGVELGTALALAAFGYLLVALVGRPQVTWPMVFTLTAVVVALRVVDLSPITVFAVGAMVLAVVAMSTGRLGAGRLGAGRLSVGRPGSGRPESDGTAAHRLRPLQVPAAWLFGGLALVATLVSVQLGSVLVAVGLIAHAGWDVLLWRARPAVVARSFVETCAVYDLIAGVGILAIVLAGT
jgi:hypothetical protein